MLTQLFVFFTAQVQDLIVQCHLCLLLGVQFLLQQAFKNYLVILGVNLTEFFAAIIVLSIYVVAVLGIISGFRAFISHAVYYLLLHTRLKVYTWVMWFLTLPPYLIITTISLITYTIICCFCCFVLVDYTFSQYAIVPKQPETELRILHQFYWFSAELHQHNHFREKFLVSGLCELNQQIIEYMIHQAKAHNAACDIDSKNHFMQLSQLRAKIVCNYIQQSTGNTYETLDYDQAIQYLSNLEQSAQKETLRDKNNTLWSVAKVQDAMLFFLNSK